MRVHSQGGVGYRSWCTRGKAHIDDGDRLPSCNSHCFITVSPRLAEKSQQFPRKVLPAILLQEMPGALDPHLLARSRDELTKACPACGYGNTGSRSENATSAGLRPRLSSSLTTSSSLDAGVALRSAARAAGSAGRRPCSQVWGKAPRSPRSPHR